VPDGFTRLVNNVIPLSWAVRAKSDPLRLRTAIEGEFRAVDGLMPVTREKLMEQVVADTIARDRFTMLLLSVFAGIALLLAAIGIYGLISYSVEQRRQEIGVRMALGAGRSEVLRLIFGQGMKLAAAGVVLGLALAFGLTRVLSSLLFGVQAVDPLTFAAVVIILLLIALSATWFPARRAAAVEPVEALGYQ
jgi:ABC-type antimicrobial peptide transport system permease subunit